MFNSVPNNVNAKFGSKKRPEIKKDAAMVSIRGVIFLDKKVTKKYLAGYIYIDIGYNYDQNQLTLKPVRVSTENSVRIIRTRKDKLAIIIKKGFLRDAGADLSENKYFQCTWDSEQEVIVIDYGNPVDREDLE
jgi:hypothetical protein